MVACRNPKIRSAPDRPSAAPHQRHLLRWHFQPIQRGVQTGTEDRLTRLTAPTLDLLSFPRAVIADDGMDQRCADPVVLAGSVGTGIPLGLHADGALAAGF
jgi:hypothetical protein